MNTQTQYTVVRLDYAIRDCANRPHQTHVFTSHRTLAAAARSAEKMQNKYNCIDVVNADGRSVEWQLLPNH